LSNYQTTQLLWHLALAFLVAGCRATPEPTAHDVVVWEELASWSGQGSVQTESFIGDTGMLRLRWDAKNTGAPTEGLLKITLHSAVSGRPLAVALEHEGTGRDIAYVSEDPRVFYLVVESADLEWSVAVDEGMAATVTEPVNR
jgi:hypothetical protein